MYWIIIVAMNYPSVRSAWNRSKSTIWVSFHARVAIKFVASVGIEFEPMRTSCVLRAEKLILKIRLTSSHWLRSRWILILNLCWRNLLTNFISILDFCSKGWKASTWSAAKAKDHREPKAFSECSCSPKESCLCRRSSAEISWCRDLEEARVFWEVWQNP
jgi:hypothetical protein